MFNEFLNSRQKSITIAAVILGVSAFISRVLGLFRDNLLANLFSKADADIYFAAFRIPDFIYAVLITGGIIAVFLPLFIEHFQRGKEDAENFFNTALSFYLTALCFLSAIFAIFTPQLIRFIVPGFSEAQKATTIVVTRIMFLSPIFLGISAVFSSLLHYFNLFIAYSLAPIFYNLGIIFGILFLRNPFGINGVAIGVVIGALAHLLIQIFPVIKKGFKFHLNFNFRNQGLYKLLKLTAPRILSSAAYHINLIVITAIASTIGVGSIRIFNFANNLQWMSIGLIGIPFATAVFPLLCISFSEQKKEEFNKTLSNVFARIIFLIIPASFFTFLFRAQLVRLVLGTSILKNGGFDWVSTRLTAASLGVFAFSLFAVALIPLLSRAFFALQDTKTPVKIAIFSMALNVFLCYFFVWLIDNSIFFQNIAIKALDLQGINNFSLIALPVALGISSFMQFILLLIFLKKKIPVLFLSDFSFSLVKILFSATAMSIISYLSLQFFATLFDTHRVSGLLLQTTLSGVIGIVSYVLLAMLLKIKEQQRVFLSIKRYFNKNQ